MLQINVDRIRAAPDVAHATAYKLYADNIVVFQEPNKKLTSDLRWICDLRLDVSV